MRETTSIINIKGILIVIILVLLIGILAVYPTAKKDDRSIYTKKSDYVEEKFRSITRFTYDGHDYISFSYRGGTAQIVHDPDCRKCKLINN